MLLNWSRTGRQGETKFNLSLDTASKMLAMCDWSTDCMHVQGGHYVANVKCEGRWYQCDDALVTRIDEVAAHAPEAYMLFYKHLPR